MRCEDLKGKKNRSLIENLSPYLNYLPRSQNLEFLLPASITCSSSLQSFKKKMLGFLIKSDLAYSRTHAAIIFVDILSYEVGSVISLVVSFAPCNRIHRGLGFRIPTRWIPDSNHLDSGFQPSGSLKSKFQYPWFYSFVLHFQYLHNSFPPLF